MLAAATQTFRLLLAVCLSTTLCLHWAAQDTGEVRPAHGSWCPPSAGTMTHDCLTVQLGPMRHLLTSVNVSEYLTCECNTLVMLNVCTRNIPVFENPYEVVDIPCPAITSAVNLLVSTLDLVPPSTKNEKLVLLHWFDQNICYAWCTRIRSVKSTARLCRILCHRHVCRRHDFCYELRRSDAIYKDIQWRERSLPHPVTMNPIYVTIHNDKVLGGGVSVYVWSREDLSEHVSGPIVALVHDRYTLVEYGSQLVNDNPLLVTVKIPLQELCKKLSVRDLLKVAKTYNIGVNKNKQSRAEMEEAIVQYGVRHKIHIEAIFKPIADQTVREKVQKHRLHKRKYDVPYNSEANKKACKKWRSGQLFPPNPPSADKANKIIQSFVHESKFEAIHEKGCAVCGCISIAKNMTPLENCRVDLSMLVKPHVTKGEHKLDGSVVPNSRGPILAPGCDSICAPCFNILSHRRTPRNALANGLWIGEVPPELQGLSWMEQKLIAKINVSRAIVRVKESKLMQMKTNVVCCASPTKHIHKTLPPKLSDFEDVMAIIFLGPNPPTPKKYKRTPLLVRRDKVATALEWLKLNHSDYADLTISYENLSEYPEDAPPVVVDYHMVEHDDINDPESTAVNTSDNEDSTSEGQSTMIVHGLVGEELTELWDKDDQQTIRLKAMKHLRESGKVMAIKLSDDLESLWHNPQLYPSMFPWLFPYGYGGLGNDKIHLNLSDATRKKIGSYTTISDFNMTKSLPWLHSIISRSKKVVTVDIF